jgi:tight adherence protein B
MILLIAFGTILLVSFGVVALFTGSSKRQKVVDRRILAILLSGTHTSSGEPIEAQLLKLDPASKFKWLNSLLQNYNISKNLKIKIVQADINTTPAMILVTAGVLALIGFVGVSMFFDLIVLQLAVAGLLGWIPFALVSFKRSRRIKQFTLALPEAIDTMSRALRAGHSTTAAINIIAEQSVEPVRSEFNEVFKQQNFGLPLRDAMGQMLDRVPSQDLRVLVTAMLVQKETGGNLAEILDRTAATIRERLKLQGEIKTHTAQGRMTGYILCALPIVMLIVINMINPGYSNMLVNTPIGKILCYLGVFLLAAGGLIIRQIINGIEI